MNVKQKLEGGVGVLCSVGVGRSWGVCLLHWAAGEHCVLCHAGEPFSSVAESSHAGLVKHRQAGACAPSYVGLL